MDLDNCLHPETVIVAVKLDNGTIQVREICEHCVTNIRFLKHRDVEIGNLPIVSAQEVRDFRSERWRFWFSQRRAIVEKEMEDKRRRYHEYLHSSEWKRIRAKIIDRAGGICEGCLEQPIESVHHLTYQNIYDELAFQLVGLCWSCHDKAHGGRKAE